MSSGTGAEPLRFETFEAYLDWEEQQPIRYELHDGDVVAMTGASEMHNRIADNVALLLNQHYGLRGRCRAFRAEMKLRVGELKSRYPDVLVACEEFGDRRFFDDARLVIEVISPEYARKDLVAAPVEHARLAGLEQYIVIDSRTWAAWSHLRERDGRFVLAPAENDRIEIPCEGVVLDFDDVYAGTPLDRSRA